MSRGILYLVLLSGLTCLVWGDSSNRPDLTGSWRIEPGKSEIHSKVPAQLTWHIEQKDDSIRLIQQFDDKKKPDELRCKTDGKDCKVKQEGRATTVSFYYNGPVLVELESQGEDAVVKKRLQVSPDGSTLTVEVLHILPAGKQPEKLVLTRQTQH
jgi:hypothetical protein